MKIYTDKEDFWNNAEVGDELAVGVIKKCEPLFKKIEEVKT